MPKQKQQSWDWKNPVSRKTAEHLARVGKLAPAAYSVAVALVTCSKESRDFARAHRRNDPAYRRIMGDELLQKLGFKSEADFEADVDKKCAKKLEDVSRVLCSAAYAGNSRAFRALAECVEFIRTNGLGDRWADPLAQQINNYVFNEWFASLSGEPDTEYGDFMRIKRRFNIAEFIEATSTSADRETIALRVRALGYSVKKGRPRGSKNKIKLGIRGPHPPI